MSKKSTSKGKPSGKQGGANQFNTPKGGFSRSGPMSRRPPRQPGR